MQHGHIKRIIQNKDGTETIITESYQERLQYVTEERRVNILTTPNTLLQDIVQALDVMSDRETRKLMLTIKTDKNGKPTKIIKEWTVGRTEV